jgi:hypothetical protein
MKKLFSDFIVFILLLQFYSCVTDCTYRTPDLNKFNEQVSSKQMQDKLKNDTIAIGMPHYVLNEIFRQCDCKKNIPVSEIGFKEPALEYEGWERVYGNPDAKIFLDEYRTSAGKLLIWYGNLDFYGQGVKRNDLIFLYNGEIIDTAKILYLTKPVKLRVNKELEYNSVRYAEIQHVDYNGVISYWYDLSVADTLILIDSFKVDNYPIYRMELNNKKIDFFNFKNLKK